MDALAALADALPTGAASIAEIEQLCDRVLAEPAFVPLPAPGASAGSAGERRQLAAGHMRAAVLAAERVVLAAAAAEHAGAGPGPGGAGPGGVRIEVVEAGQGYPLSAEQRAVLHDVVTSGRAAEAIVVPAAATSWARRRGPVQVTLAVVGSGPARSPRGRARLGPGPAGAPRRTRASARARLASEPARP